MHIGFLFRRIFLSFLHMPSKQLKLVHNADGRAKRDKKND